MHKKAFTADNASMLLIDHQLGTMGWTHSHDINLVKANALKLARIAKALNVPVVLTASMEDQVQGPLMPELEQILPEAFAKHWVKHYTDKGYGVIAANWPGMEGDVELLRRDPSSFANLGLTDIVDHYEQIIGELETPSIIIGHGFGGLIAQVLLDRGWGAAGVAIASAPVRGIARLPLSMLKLAFSVLGNSFRNKTASLTAEQFHRAFANSLTETESLDAFKRYTVPAPNRVLLQTAFANFTRHTAITLNFRNDTRAPLLLVAGGKDRIVPSSIVKANFDLYRESKAETDYKEFSDQAHFTLLQETRVADYVLGWALYRSNGSKLTAVPNQTGSWSVQL